MLPRSSRFATSNLPTRMEVRVRAGRELPDWLAQAEGLSTDDKFRGGLFDRITDAVNSHAQGHEDHLARARRGWLKWVPRYAAFGYACLSEPMLADYHAPRMLGLAMGFTSEGVGLASYLFGVLCDEEDLHASRPLWVPFLEAAKTLIQQTLHAMNLIQEWAKQNGHPPFTADLEGSENLRLLESYQTAIQTLRSVDALAEELLEDSTFESGKLKATMAARGDVERCSLQAEYATQFLESQGAFLGARTPASGQTWETVVPLDRDTMEYLELCKLKINKARATLDLLPITRHQDLIHEVARLMVGSDHPYYPSPWREGRGASGHKRNHLDLDLEKLASSLTVDIKTLRDYVERGKVLHTVGARSLALVAQASLKLRCHYRYFVCPVPLEGLPSGRGYRLVVKSIEDAPPRDALSAEEIQDLLNQETALAQPRRGPGRPLGSTGKHTRPGDRTGDRTGSKPDAATSRSSTAKQTRGR